MSTDDKYFLDQPRVPGAELAGRGYSNPPRTPQQAGEHCELTEGLC